MLTEAEDFLIFADKAEGIVGMITLPRDPSHPPNAAIPDSGYRKHILIRSPAPVGVGYDPVDEVVYWSDVNEKALYRMSLATGDKEVFLEWEDGIGIVDGRYTHVIYYFSLLFTTFYCEGP